MHAAASRGAEMHELPLDVKAPDGTPLSIDIAWLGSSRPAKVVIHSSGLHGVEGFAGSAIQLALLDRDLEIPDGAAVVLAHVLNPYGMAWLRRVNENNVDLNRNFGDADDDRSGVPEQYLRLQNFLNPASLPASDMFYLRAAGLIARHGLPPLKQAIAEGQYEIPEGLFYGGKQLERGPALLQSWLAQHLTALEQGFAIDVHTGLGRSCQESLFLYRACTDDQQLAAALGRTLVLDAAQDGVGYRMRGGYPNAFDTLPGRPRIGAVLQEFGTYPSVRVLHALREENRWHHYGDGSIEHASKLRLKEMFAPRATKWRESVFADGVSLAISAMRYTFN